MPVETENNSSKEDNGGKEVALTKNYFADLDTQSAKVYAQVKAPDVEVKSVAVGENPPTITGVDLANTPANVTTLAPILQYYSPTMTPLINIRFPWTEAPSSPVVTGYQQLHEKMQTWIPQYDPKTYIKEDEVKLDPGKIDTFERIAHQVEVETVKKQLERYAKEHEIPKIRDIPEKIALDTEEEVKERIRRIAPAPHQVMKSVKVGNVTAVEVIPMTGVRIDPLYVTFETGSPLDMHVNKIFERAFVHAFIGKANEDRRHTNIATKIGISAGLVAFSGCLRGDDVQFLKLHELLFSTDLVWGSDRALINGFAQL